MWPVPAKQESTVSGKNIATVQLEISVQIAQNVATNLSTKLVLCPLATTLLWMANILPMSFKGLKLQVHSITSLN